MRAPPADAIGNAVKVMRIATGEEAETLPGTVARTPPRRGLAKEWRGEDHERRQSGLRKMQRQPRRKDGEENYERITMSIFSSSFVFEKIDMK